MAKRPSGLAPHEYQVFKDSRLMIAPQFIAVIPGYSEAAYENTAEKAERPYPHRGHDRHGHRPPVAQRACQPVHRQQANLQGTGVHGPFAGKCPLQHEHADP